MEKAGLLCGTAMIHTNGLVKEKAHVTKMLTLYPISLKKIKYEYVWACATSVYIYLNHYHVESFYK